MKEFSPPRPQKKKKNPDIPTTTLRKGKGMNQDTIYFLQIEFSWYKSLVKLQMIWDPLTNCTYNLKVKKESFLI